MSIATLPKTLSTNMPQQSSGYVVNILPDKSIIVDVNGLGWHCRRAASCLIMPEIGDIVLLSQPVNDTLWLLAVLEKATQKPQTEIAIQGDLTISTQGGSLILNSEQTLEMRSNTLQITTIQAQYAIEKLTYQGDEIDVHVGVNRWIGERYESVWHTTTQLSQLSFRRVENTEHLRAGQLDYQAQDYLRLHSHNTLITAEKITKIDSEQIHVG
ncbi:DUF3540 domain-containing protein [Proteus mirabilis]|uniref:DUF3540 domain-containing protein n=1 Tax=Proteus mirabilis TaxID=584 RepID=UPI000F87A2B0|nr:DUF3540 domain-containing protein [Proteus mirabilis]MDC9752908.1 DUF3540 domain-containing protein [Proteus mirabilis]RUL08986.1 DUF3540 domain-containing protein [Proteus mirabilis]WJI12202.1 DUF3540 domain-containing protein [Proteus mirabilis]HEK0776097.1 DUF3540 domain-containing protein [Proteus mirabilis]